MNRITELLQKRKQIKIKKPDFVMQDAHKKARLKQKWRKPRGIDSKMRLNLKGYNKCVEPGYGSPKAVRGLDKSGLKPVRVSSIKELEKINREFEAIIINSGVSRKKKVGIIKKAVENDIRVLNIKDTGGYIKKIEADFKARKEEKLKKHKKKEEKKEKIEKKGRKDDKLAEKIMDEEEKALLEKKEKDKLLTKKI